MAGEKNIICPLCNCTSAKIYDSVKEWKLMKCSQCDFVFTHPLPMENEMKGFYDEKYFTDALHKEKYFSAEGNDETENENEYLNRLKQVENFTAKRGRILDVGAARGAMLSVFKKYGWEVSGIEISESAVVKAKSLYEVDLFCGTIENFSSEKKFDVITFYQSLEHILNPNKVFQKAFDLLVPGGILVVEVPNINSIENKLSKKLRLQHYDVPRHVSHFSLETLNKLFIQNNFEIIFTETYWSIYQIKLYNFFQNIFWKKRTISTQAKPVEEQIEIFKQSEHHRRKSPLNMIAEKFPGWRITIIGRKPIETN